MSLPQQIAKQVRQLYFGGNWASSNIKDTLANTSWQQATYKVYELNTIAALLFHTHYYIAAVLKVMKGGALDAHDKFSFDHPPISSQQDWDNMLQTALSDAEIFAALVEQLPEEKLSELFVAEKYGTWYSNLVGIIEHTYYHLGQIAMLKKITRQFPDKEN